MGHNFSSVKEIMNWAKERMEKALEVYQKELSEIRTGKASASLVEEIRVHCYGQVLPLKQLASVSIPDAHLILIQPWDPNIIQEIERALANSKLGVSPTDDGKVIRVVLPPLSEERRKELDKVARQEAEHARISLRTIRREAKEAIEKLEKEKIISEDESFKAKEDLQKLVDKFVSRVEEILEEKEKELKVLEK